MNEEAKTRRAGAVQPPVAAIGCLSSRHTVLWEHTATARTVAQEEIDSLDVEYQAAMARTVRREQSQYAVHEISKAPRVSELENEMVHSQGARIPPSLDVPVNAA